MSLRICVCSLVLLASGPCRASQEVARAPYRLFDSRRGFTAWTSPRYEQVPVGRDDPVVVGKFMKKGNGPGGYLARYRSRYQYILLDDRVRPDYYLKQQFRGRLIIAERRPRRIALDAVRVKEFHLTPNPEKPFPGGPQEGLAVFFHHRGAYAGFIGLSPRNSFKKERATFRKLAYTIRFPSADAPRTASAARDPYPGSTLRGIQARRAIRAELIPGWKAVDTENYIIVHHAAVAAFANRLGRKLEILHAQFRECCPPSEPVTRVATARVCRGTQEYYLLGGRPTRAGYFDARSEDLVLQVNEKGKLAEDREGPGRVALYEQAYFQYLHVFAGKLKPHRWYVDAHGDYFAGLVLSPSEGRVRSVRPRAGLVKAICEAVRSGRCPTPGELMAMPLREYYRERTLHRAAAWSVVYFLRRSAAAKASPDRAKLLDTYFRVLRDTHTRLTAALAADASRSDRNRAAATARSAALEAALEGVDAAALDKAWRKFVLSIRARRK